MEKIKEYKGLIILILIAFVGIFSWYEWKQALVRRHCTRFMVQHPEDVYGDAYYECLKKQLTN